MTKRLLVVVFIVIAIVVGAVSPRGMEIRRQFAINRGCCDFSLLQTLRMTAREAICRMEKVVVSSVAGQVVKFHTHAGLGGIADTLGKWKDEATKSPAVELTTTTLAEVLARYHAPSFIHFLSLDIEGAELEALKGVPFDRYRFGAMAIEHNDEEPKRTDILNFLEERGYRRSHSYQQDDFYVPR